MTNLLLLANAKKLLLTNYRNIPELQILIFNKQAYVRILQY